MLAGGHRQDQGPAQLTLAELNSLALLAFVDRLGGVFEHSPWVAECAFKERPFSSVDALHRAMTNALHDASVEEQIALVRAHPELAGTEATKGQLTRDSSSEQGRLGFVALDKHEFQKIAGLNRRYRDKFGFPCIVALRLHGTRASVLDEMERRLDNTFDAELYYALQQIGHIARGRLAKMLGEE